MAAILIFPAIAFADAVTVTITQRAPIESVSATGEITGVKEASVGDKLTWISTDGSQLTLQDAQGTHYRIALSATDYTPPAVATAPAPTPATNVPAPSPSPIVAAPSVTPPAIATASAAPVVPVNPAPTLGGPPRTVSIGDRATAKEMAVWPDGGIAGRPLLVASHGRGGTGPGEIKGWLGIAKEHRFTIVCPSFLSAASNSNLLSEDADYFKDCLRWIANNLQYDKANVYMTGFSGGGFPTWYLATQRPEIFRGIFLQSGNFSGDYFDLNLSKWYNKPIKIVWGSQDLPDIPVQNKQALDMLKSADCKNVTSEVIEGAHHQPHHDLVVAWIEQVMASSPAAN